MIGKIWRCLLAISCASLTFVHATEDTKCGVGFELSLDYGVASINCNGSTVDVTKIEGSPAYKQMMRTIDINGGTSDVYQTIATQAPFGLQSLRDYLPPWLGGNRSHTGSSESLSRMLKALKTATESYLETPLLTARVTLPFPVTSSFYNDLHSAASSSLSLHVPSYRMLPAGRYAAYAHGIGVGWCGYDDDYSPEQLYLTVEYSRAALTALLFYEDCRLHELKRVLHDIHLGTDSLSEKSSTSRRAELMSFFRDITKLPLNTGGWGSKVKWISNLVLLGESADDWLLHDVLKDVLSEQQPGRLVSAAAAGLKGSIDPVFAASRGLAGDDWDRKNYEEPQEPYGCPI